MMKFCSLFALVSGFCGRLICFLSVRWSQIYTQIPRQYFASPLTLQRPLQETVVFILLIVCHRTCKCSSCMMSSVTAELGVDVTLLLLVCLLCLNEAEISKS